MPEVLDENYYIRSKQEAERLVVAARGDLANACIHRVGNVVFAAEGGPLQFNIRENAFFRQLAAFLRLGVVPDDSHLWLCHVDVVARGLVLLAHAADLTNETHHLENARRDTLAAFVTAAEGVRACGFDAFLERLEEAVDEPEMGSGADRDSGKLRSVSRRVAAGASAPAGNRLGTNSDPAGPVGARLAACSGRRAGGNAASGGPVFLAAVIVERYRRRPHIEIRSEM